MELTEVNRQAQAQWNNRACGIRDGDTIPAYKEMARRRYIEDDPWVPAVLDFPSMKGKQVLEIGHGMGCDLATAALNGAITHGIDLTPNHHEIAKQTFADLGLKGDFHLGNAGNLPFADASMDVVFSLGVLHHTDNTEQCLAEAHRVLKPGGRFVMALYNFWSVPHALNVAIGAKNGQLRKLGYRNYLATIERGADGVDIRPLVKLYTARETRALLSDFSKVAITKHGYNPKALGIPGIGASLIEPWLGWYVVADCVK